MCGIAGLISSSSRRWSESAEVFKLLRHRGPDDLGWMAFRSGKIETGRGIEDEISGEVVLLHRRLSILDLSPGGHQPMSTPDGRFWIVFNGEIYNFIELRAELEKLGHSFTSTSDTEVLLAAYAQWGPGCLGRLVGMFAFAVFDAKERTVFLARDFFGIKPLYCTHWEGGLAFASEIKPLLKLPGVCRKADPAAVYQYLYRGRTDVGGQTMLKSVFQIPPGHWCMASIGDKRWPQSIEYWSPNTEAKADLSYDAAVQTLRELFLENVRLHLRSDVPVGAALSGGIDSSAIVSCMRRISGPGAEIHTFTYVETDKRLAEEHWADIVVSHSQTKSHKVFLNAEDLRKDFQELIRCQDEPFAGTSIYAQYAIFRAAKQAGIKVMLDGQGADELLGGYAHLISAKMASLIRSGAWTRAAKLAQKVQALPGVRLSYVLQEAIAYFVPEAFNSLALRMAGRSPEPAWLRGSWFRARDVFPERIGSHNLRSKPKLAESLAYNLRVSPLPSLLRYEDRNSMAHSIESRVPFLTPTLANFIYSLPEDFIVSDSGRTKSIFRDAMDGIVPRPILERKDKIGFATNEARWMQELMPWVEKTLSSETARHLPPLVPEAMMNHFKRVCARGQGCDYRLWRWLNFIEWSAQNSVSFD